jgi:hypothetical protein
LILQLTEPFTILSHQPFLSLNDYHALEVEIDLECPCLIWEGIKLPGSYGVMFPIWEWAGMALSNGVQWMPSLSVCRPGRSCWV